MCELILRQQHTETSMTATSAIWEFERVRIFAVRRKSGLTGRTAANAAMDERQVWAVLICADRVFWPHAAPVPRSAESPDCLMLRPA